MSKELKLLEELKKKSEKPLHRTVLALYEENPDSKHIIDSLVKIIKEKHDEIGKS
jgi:hypothetical protein